MFTTEIKNRVPQSPQHTTGCNTSRTSLPLSRKPVVGGCSRQKGSASTAACGGDSALTMPTEDWLLSLHTSSKMPLLCLLIDIRTSLLRSRVQAGTALAGKTSQALQSWTFSRSTASGRQLPEEDSRLKEEIREKLRKEQTVLKFVLRRIPAFLSDVQNLCPHTFLILFSSQLWSRLLEICPSGRTQIPFLGLGRDPAGLRSNKLGSVEAGSMRGKVEM